MSRCTLPHMAVAVILLWNPASASAQYSNAINTVVPAIATDKDVKYDYDIVYVRVPREGGKKHPLFAEVFHPTGMDPGGKLTASSKDKQGNVSRIERVVTVGK